MDEKDVSRRLDPDFCTIEFLLATAEAVNETAAGYERRSMAGKLVRAPDLSVLGSESLGTYCSADDGVKKCYAPDSSCMSTGSTGTSLPVDFRKSSGGESLKVLFGTNLSRVHSRYSTSLHIDDEKS